MNNIKFQSNIMNSFYKAIDKQNKENENLEIWLNDILNNENRDKKEYCEICGSKENLELHHIRGRKNGNETITVCHSCHVELTKEQNLWDRSWLDPNNKNKDSFLIRGLIDIFKLKYDKTHIEIYRLFAENLISEFNYD